MTSHNLPHYRVDNVYPFIASLFVLLLTLGSFFVYLNRLTVVETNQVTMMQTQIEIKATQKEILVEFREWKKQAEQRIGQNENEIAVLQSEHKRLLQ